LANLWSCKSAALESAGNKSNRTRDESQLSDSVRNIMHIIHVQPIGVVEGHLQGQLLVAADVEGPIDGLNEVIFRHSLDKLLVSKW